MGKIQDSPLRIYEGKAARSLRAKNQQSPCAKKESLCPTEKCGIRNFETSLYVGVSECSPEANAPALPFLPTGRSHSGMRAKASGRVIGEVGRRTISATIGAGILGK